MRNLLCIVTLSLFLLSCGSNNRHEYTPPVLHEVVEEETARVVDTLKTTETRQKAEETKAPSTPASSSASHPHKSSSYDNMRGFDPASEDDKEDNGMSRYMENNDEEGWY
ncbi:MAG: hypothetical protein IK135_00580 [Bacteroidales bacterium]|nr:hypothetical protein [Bacteroidales bacterium]